MAPAPDSDLSALELDAILVEDVEAAALRAHFGSPVLAPDRRSGVPSLDEEHALCEAQLERLIDASGDAHRLGAALAEARELFASHFASEEHLMRATGFPGADANAAVHAEFLGEIEHHAEEVAAVGVGAGVSRWLAEAAPGWFSEHLVNAASLASHMRREGADPAAADVPWRAGLPKVGTPAADAFAQPVAAAVPVVAPPGAPSDPATLAELQARAAAVLAAASEALAASDAEAARRELEAAQAMLSDLFEREERAMTESGYAGADHHAVAHDLVLAALRLLREEGSAHRRPLASWFAAHRASNDRPLLDHLARVANPELLQ